VNDSASEAEHSGRGPVRTIRPHDYVDADSLAVDTRSIPEIDARSLTNLDSLLLCRFQEERVESPSLSHPDDGSAGVPLDAIGVAKSQLDDIDLLLYDRRWVDRAT